VEDKKYGLIEIRKDAKMLQPASPSKNQLLIVIVEKLKNIADLKQMEQFRSEFGI
jgi:hypothetical protein